MRRSGLQRGYVGEPRGVCAPLSWTTLPAGVETQELSPSRSCSASPGFVSFCLFERRRDVTWKRKHKRDGKKMETSRLNSCNGVLSVRGAIIN